MTDVRATGILTLEHPLAVNLGAADCPLLRLSYGWHNETDKGRKGHKLDRAVIRSGLGQLELFCVLGGRSISVLDLKPVKLLRKSVLNITNIEITIKSIEN